MDFDYQKLKDAESQQREERLSAFSVLHPIPKPRPSVAPENHPTTKKPPVKPRRSIKCRPTAQQEPEQLHQGQQKENETTVKRIDPALVLGPMGPLEALTSSLRAHTLLWFERTQLPRLHTPGQPLPCWLHGFATRREAEQLLQDKPQGCFLLRLSESKIGFVLSYRGEDRCRHFIIEEEESGASGSVYLIAGENSRHRSLDNLISYYTRYPVGPFNELLTVPCVQPNGGFEEINRWKVKDREAERNRKETDQEKQTKLPMAIGPAVLNPLPTNPSNQITSATDESVQYAAVRKPLKKSYSLPECNCGPNTAAPPGVENGISELAEKTSEDHAPAVDAPYARVNKPPRAVSENTPNLSAHPHPEQQGATAAFTPSSIPSFDTTAADQKYWKMEPMHTYEETPHTRTRSEEIDCYAMGWRRQVPGDAANLPNNHLYSEVNIKGAQEGSAVPRPGPSLPLRPPPRSPHGPLRPEVTGQSFGASPLIAQTQNSGFHHSEQPHLESSSSIYEQIPERSTSSRPFLPPPTHKR
ncbi:SH2 domain-containing protein 2A [Anabarilius grahami]|uniref:SH2 domain-containing protein 2A n=1 Tax=Anabarilius grahami TaxID=495550 RepID=A0A3N0YIV7_ANAGA|nr:SH2 domain-containing protein 2A [Anabarilius grahami]